MTASPEAGYGTSDRTLHVVHLYDGHEEVYGGRGSVPGVLWNLARVTARAGHEVTVIERQWEGLDAFADHDGVAFERIPLRTGADEPWERVPYEQVTSPVGVARLVCDRTNFALAAGWRLRDREFDVLHVHLPFAANVLITAAPWLREKTVYTAHLGELRLDALTDDQQGPAADTNEAATGTTVEAPAVLSVASPDIYLADRVAHTTVLNETIRDAMIGRGVSPETLSVLPNGVDLERFTNVSERDRERVRDEYGLGDDPVLLFVGTIMPRKGVVDLVRATELLANDVNEVTGGEAANVRVEDNAETETADVPLQLVLAGEDDLDGEYVAEVREQVAEAGVGDVVSLPGFVPEEDLPALYAVADVFVLPSREEGFGMTVIEAMATGTPVVGTRVGAIEDIVDDGVQGYLVDPGDPPRLARSIKKLLTAVRDRDRSTETRERARQYSWDSIGRRCVSIYEEVSK